MSVLDRIIDHQSGETILKLQEARKRELRALIDACNAMTGIVNGVSGHLREMSEADLEKQEKFLPEITRVKEQMQIALREARFDTTLV